MTDSNTTSSTAATPAGATPATRDPAQVLYGNNPGSNAAAPTTEPDKTDPAQAIYGRKTTEADSGAELYTPESTYGRYFDEGLNRLSDHLGNLTPEELGQARKDMSEIFNHLEVEPYMADRMATLYTHHIREPASDELVQTWEKETRTALRDRYGAEAESHLALAREIVAANPSLHEVLAMTGLGSHPGVVLDLIERAPRVRAKLKR